MTNFPSLLHPYLVRATGFAFERLESLRCSRAADFTRLLDRAAAQRLRAGKELDADLSARRYTGNSAFDEPTRRKVLSRHVKQLRAFARQLAVAPFATAAFDEIANVVPEIRQLGQALAERDVAWRSAQAAYAKIFVEDFEAARANLRALYANDRVLETAARTPRARDLGRAIAQVQQLFEMASAGSVAVADLEAALALAAPPTHVAYISVDIMLRQLADRVGVVVSEVHGLFWLPTALLDVLPDGARERTVDQMRDAVSAMARGRRTAECMFLYTQATDRRFALASTDLHLLVPSSRPGSIDLGTMELMLVDDAFVFTCKGEQIVPLVALKISEMLPAPDELLTHAPDGLRTSELRMGFYRS